MTIGMSAAYLACTNMQLNQVQSRFYDNMNGNLKSFPNPTISNPSSFSFSAIGDAHIGSTGGNLFTTALTKSLAGGDSFAVTTGDDSNTGQTTEMVAFNNQIASIGLPVYPAIGNHDIFFGGWANYKITIGRSIYSFNAGVVHFIMLGFAMI
jgi:hypothetical protein